MPSKSKKQCNTAKLAGAVKSGKFPKSKAGKAVRSMAKMPMKKLKHFMKMKESMTLDQKKKFLKILESIREEYTGNVGGETDITNADNLISEDEFTAAIKPERNVIAKTFDTHADFDSYVNQRRGIEITPKEQQSIIGFRKTKPTQQDKFFIKYEITDAFGQNNTTVIKKLKEGNQFCWTAFSKYETAEEEGSPEKPPKEKPEEPKKELPELPSTPPLKELASSQHQPSNQPSNQPSQPEDTEITIDDPIRITKTVTFISDNDGANILSDLLNSGKLDL